MAARPIWYELMTPDPDSVRDFYRAVVGWEIGAAGMTAGAGDNDYRTIQRGDGAMAGGVLRLSEVMLAGGAKPCWLPYFDVADVDAAVAKVQELGGKVWMPARTIEVGRMAMVADPQGAPFYVMDPIPPQGRTDARSDVFQARSPGHCRWNELETPDEPGATAFYTALFGWNADQAMPMGEKGNYRFVAAAGEQIGAINPWMADFMTVGWLPYFGVVDIDAGRIAAEANGGKITHDVHEVPGGDFIFTATDPAGAPVGFVGPKGA